MKLNDFTDMMEKIAPRELALDFDNPGLLIGTNRTEIKKVLVALDLTVETAKEAIDFGADLVLTHHPIFFAPVKSICPKRPDTAAAYMLIQAGIAHFAAHTNLDIAQGGVNDALAESLGLLNIVSLPPENLGRVGTLKTPMTLEEFARFVQEKLDTKVRICGESDSTISRVAVIGGSGGSECDTVHAFGADVLVTGEIKHSQALSARCTGLNIVEAGHYETERVVLMPLIKHLQTMSNDIQYKLTLSERTSLRGV